MSECIAMGELIHVTGYDYLLTIDGTYPFMEYKMRKEINKISHAKHLVQNIILFISKTFFCASASGAYLEFLRAPFSLLNWSTLSV